MSEPDDEQWQDLNRQLKEAMAANDFQRISQLYFEMALQTYHEGRGFRHLLEQRAKSELMRWKRAGFVTHVNVHAVENSCPQCKKLNGAQFAIKDALQNMPLPQTDCSHESDPGKPGWCRCIYLPVIEDTKPDPPEQKPEPKSGSPFNCSTAIVFVIIIVICGCALLWYIPQLTP